MIHRGTLKKISMIACFTFLLGCQPETPHNLIDYFRTLSFLHPHALSTKIRLGLFEERDHANLNDPKTLETKPQIIWTRIRNHFQLDHAEHHPRVKKYIKQFSQSNYYLNQLSRNANPYLYLILEEIHKRDIPFEIALLPMVESNFNPNAVSRMGAHGLWQIMPSTGKILGLTQDWWYDGRKDIQASTRAALNHLQYLYRSFDGDWLLALAAYNSGENRVLRAIQYNNEKNKPTDFWNLNLPSETQDYVPKLLALCAIVNNPAKYGVTLPAINNKPYVQAVEIGHQIDLSVLASISDISVEDLERLNPAFHHNVTHPNGPHRLLVPISQAPQMIKQLRRTDPALWVNFKRYQVKSGESLSSIAKRFDTSIKEIKEVNMLENDHIVSGHSLIIPPSSGVQGKEEKVVHVVKAGDSLWGISKRYNIHVEKIKSWNNLSNDALKPGQEIIIYTT